MQLPVNTKIQYSNAILFKKALAKSVLTTNHETIAKKKSVPVSSRGLIHICWWLCCHFNVWVRPAGLFNSLMFLFSQRFVDQGK